MAVTLVRVKEMQPGVIDSTCLPLQITPAFLKPVKGAKLKEVPSRTRFFW